MTLSTDVFQRLAAHLSMTGMPLTDALVDLLKETFTENQAQIALLLTPWPIPLKTQTIDEIAGHSGISKDTIQESLDALVAKNLIFYNTNANGQKAYAFHHAGFGFPQSFFWNGSQSETAQKMTKLVLKYFNRDTTKKAFGGTDTKPYRYIPIHQSLEPDLQAVLPHDRMQTIIDNADTIAVAHCPCRVQAKMWGRGCDHSLEVCLKFDELADYLIDRELGRPITKKEATYIIDQAAKEGLVHFVDNVASKVKHNCNCCGCACWNVGSIRRRRIPRDELMAVYFLRTIDPDNCTGCESCVDICPVAAIDIKDGIAVVDQEWCIGCGVCATQCDFDAVHITYRDETPSLLPDISSLYTQIAQQRKLSK